MIRVIKLGGSLLSRASLSTDLRDWLREQPAAAANLMIVGGGPLLNAVRQLDAIHAFDEIAMHWRCIRMLRGSFEMLAELLPDWTPIATAAEFHRYHRQPAFTGNHVLAVDTFFTPEADGGLPQSWSTTSDSIAAVLAHRVRADELVVFKSCQLAASPSLTDCAAAGILDSVFPLASAGIPRVRIENLPCAAGS